MSITSLRGSTLPNRSFTAGQAKTRDVVRIAPESATTFANGAAISAGSGGSGPTISNVSVTDSNYIVSNTTPYIDSTGGYIKITGTGFATGCTAYVGGSAATATTFVSATEVRAQVGAAASNAQSVYVVNTDSSVGIKLNAITYSGTPSWSTSATLTSQVSDVAFSIALSATSDSSIVYTVASGSSVPAGTTLYSNGVFAGTVTGISNDTNYSFTVVATDIENQLSARSFTVSVSTGDQYFNISPLLLNGEANVWITDSSTNKFLPTITNDTKPTAFSPYNTNWSAYFDGTGDYLTCTYNTTFSTGDFTVECWVYMPVITNTYSSAIIGTTYYDGLTKGWSLEINSSGYPIFTLYNTSGTGVTTTSSTLLSANQWTHLAAVRSGTTVTIYMNGVSVASGTNATTDNFSNSIYFATNSTSFAIGQRTYSYAGYISNARIVVGTAVYTGNFTPQTTLLTLTQSSGANIAAISSGTSLLTLQNNRFKDNSANAFAVTRTGDVAIRSFGPFVETDVITGSAYLDGTGDYLSIPYSAAFAFTGDFTAECWIYWSSTSHTAYAGILSCAGSTDPWTGGWQILFSNTNNYFMVEVNGSVLFTGSGITLTPFQWYHIALVRVGSTLSLYYNGNIAGSGTSSATINSSSAPLLIGIERQSTNAFVGYITDVRVVKGVGVYTGNFTPTTSSLTSTQTSSTNVAAISSTTSTSVLTLQYRRGDNNHRFVDEGGNKYVAIRGGQVSQGSFSPFSPAGWSGYFNGSSDYLSIAASTGFNNLSGTTFTLEFWMYPTALASGALYNEGRTIFSTAATFPNGFRIELTTTSITWYDYVGSTRISYAASINTWTHVAFTYSSNNLIMYINGQNRGSASSVTWNNSSGAALIGALNSGSYVYYYQGYISNLRLVSNLVYTGNFTPQTSSLTSTQSSGSNIAAITTGQTVFLTLQNNRFIDANTTPKTVSVAAGAPSIQAFSPFRPSGSYSPVTHGGSAYFDGSGDYLKALSTSMTLLPTSSTNTFTVDGWIYPTALGSQRQLIGDMIADGGVNNVAVQISSSNKIALYWWTGGENRATSADSVVLNQWNYFAVVVNNNAITIYVNSTTAGQTGTTTLTTRSLGTSGWGIGAVNSNEYFTGYMSGMRWSTGIARTISAIPTAPPTPDNYSTLLFNFTQGGIVDATGRVNFETVGDAKISNATSKFGIGSLFFDGTGDYLTTPDSALYNFGSGDFTIEFWTYITTYTSDFKFVIKASSVSNYWQFAFNNGGTIGPNFNYNNNAAGQVIVAQQGNTTGWATNTWYHVALVRNGTAVNIYKDGSSVASGTLSGALVNPAGAVTIAGTGVATAPLNGYLDDLRITRFARYTANFTAPTTAFLTK